jgi:ABC-type multidrug transport system fused ATPase/permease subunit
LVGSLAIVVFQILLDYYKIIEMRKIGLKAGELLHKKYLNTIFKTPMTWFDGKPSG